MNNDDELGINGIKFQQVITKKIKMKQRSSVDDHPLNEKFLSTIRNSSNNLLEPPQQKQEKKFTFIVSSDSSDNEGTLGQSPVLSRKSNSPTRRVSMEDLQIQRLGYMDGVKEGYDDQAKAIANLQILLKKNTKQNQGSFKGLQSQMSSSSNFLSPTSRNYIRTISKKPVEDKSSSQEKEKDKEKRQINFLKGLQQNQNLQEHIKLDEFYTDGKIVVKMQSRDFLTFMRLQHEVEELKRKQNDFNEQKERHFNLATGNKIEQMEQDKIELQKQNSREKFTKSWIVGISLAKRFLRKGRKNRTAQPSPQAKFVRNENKSTLIKINPQPRSSTVSPSIGKKLALRINNKLKLEDK